MKRRQKQRDTRRAIGYIRVSTAEQKLGPKAQAEALDAWATREGVQLVALFVDEGVSGATPLTERPALLGALQALESTGSGVLVAAKRDRLARSVVVVATIEAEAARVGATVRTADGASDAAGSGGVLTRGLHDLLAQWERAVIGERTRAALSVKKARGERVGGVPYGWKVGADGVRLEPAPAEKGVIALVAGLAAEGRSTRAIVAQLAVRGVLSRSGRPFGQTQVVRMLASGCESAA